MTIFFKLLFDDGCREASEPTRNGPRAGHPGPSAGLPANGRCTKPIFTPTLRLASRSRHRYSRDPLQTLLPVPLRALVRIRSGRGQQQPGQRQRPMANASSTVS